MFWVDGVPDARYLQQDKVIIVDLDDMVGEEYYLNKVWGFISKNSNQLKNASVLSGAIWLNKDFGDGLYGRIDNIEYYYTPTECYFFRGKEEYLRYGIESYYFTVSGELIDYGSILGIPYKMKGLSGIELNIYFGLSVERTRNILNDTFKKDARVRSKLLRGLSLR